MAEKPSSTSILARRISSWKTLQRLPMDPHSTQLPDRVDLTASGSSAMNLTCWSRVTPAGVGLPYALESGRK
jgi:hypothetical protein